MEDTLMVGDRVVVEKVSHRFRPVQRGDIVVFDGAGSFVPSRRADSGTVEGVIRRAAAAIGVGQAAGEVFIKRVIGVGGDRVRCCAPDGHIMVNDEPVLESYLRAGDVPSATTFDVVVPAGKVWLMGDHRAVSSDSRAHLGDPGGGMVPLTRIIGRAGVRVWPTERLGTLPQAIPVPLSVSRP
jgi:signal peptidase I